ncbi:MAG: rhomboid family intramembrane serine protease [Bacteroidales bacterium]|nr:rhomboid family intramembrane serine protease [Bacteroidales bacterium]
MEQRLDWNTIKYKFKNKSALIQIIILNVAVFLLVNIIGVFAFLFQGGSAESGLGTSAIAEFFAVPSDFSALILHPWSILTYMFLHQDLWHMFFNMVVLYFGGRIFLEYMDEKKLWDVYILGGLAGALFFILAFNIFPVFSDSAPVAIALGASASVIAVLVGIASYAPNYSVNLIFIGKIKLKHIAMAFVILDIITIPQGNAGGHIAHLGGAFWGFFHMKLLAKGSNPGRFIRLFTFDRLKSFFFTPKKSHPFKDIHYNNRKSSDADYNADKKKKQKQIDGILDKISKSGYESLSKEEKEILFKASNKR